MRITLKEDVAILNNIYVFISGKEEETNPHGFVVNSCFFEYFLKFYFEKLVADIKTWSKNIIKLDSVLFLGASFFPTKRSLFY